MNLRALALFKEIYWSNSVTGGASRVGMSQPSASRMLRHLEDQLGYALFDRLDGRIQPTAEAKILIQDVDQIFLRVQQTSSVAKRLAHGGGERMAVVCVHTLAPIIMPRVMATLHQRYPSLELGLDTKGQAEQLYALSCRAADLGLATGFAPPTNVDSKVFGRSRFVAIMPASHELASREVVHLEDYARYPCILGSGHDPIGGLVMEQFTHAGIRPDVRVTLGSPLLCYEAVRNFGYLAIGGGLTTLTMYGNPDIVIRPIEPAFDFAVYALWNPQTPSSGARKLLLSLLEQALKPILSPSPALAL
ncbi:LysR family transcriptional regulator [Roseomonas marmotae]|uniref:LysR family transcriptional regulator n=1 Tax=Roseomonas marmotae TaxID=2768161 RepID=A0ABS3KJT3_9PROT|nr:LysR family transcriptional regulator [Roseomonas marmotae]MBO1077267.1 LysR family transcriptional regulator [Roseomonas marmotae]QTI81067.1 LysR family transcriptional regulator [Roseomonas marmotae]